MTTQTKRSSLPCLGIAALLAAQFGCFSSAPSSSTQAMHPSASVPAAHGIVKISKAKNGNTALMVSVAHLAPAAMVAADATTYIVWIQPRNADIQSVGVLVLNADLKGTLHTLTAHSRFTVTLTPEASAYVTTPSHQPVLIAEVVRHD